MTALGVMIMPKGEVKKISVNKNYFMAVLKAKHYSIRKMSDLHGEICSDRTLRRSLNSGKIQYKYIDEIAKLLDVDPRYLTGEIVRIDSNMSRVENVSLQYYLSQMDSYPYSRKELDELQKTAIREHLTNLLSLFDFSYKQFELMDFETQYNFQHELFDAIIPILAKYFKEDGYGNKERPALDTLVMDLESYYDNEYQLQYADTILRKNFIQNPPHSYTAKKIQTMTREEILDLDMYLQWKDYESSPEELDLEKRIYKKYDIYTEENS